jgi:threonine/homoserine/homoserine lactone efflux protein
VSGLGAATADMMYGLIAGFGLTVISDFLIGQHLWIQLVGGLFLCYLGIRTFTSKTTYSSDQPSVNNILSSYFSVLLQTITNPMTILSFTAIFAGLGIASTESNGISALFLVTGVFIGSALWWIFLSTGVGLIKDRLNSNLLSTINRLSGITIVLFGLISLYRLF